MILLLDISIRSFLHIILIVFTILNFFLTVFVLSLSLLFVLFVFLLMNMVSAKIELPSARRGYNL